MPGLKRHKKSSEARWDLLGWPCHTIHQLRAIQRALDLIEERLREPLRLADLARNVGMSLWHFQRTFSAMVGQPAGSYIRRRRLAEAARCLRATARTIL